MLAALGLLAGFFALTHYEARRGVRVFARARADLDQRVARAEFILTHVDFAAFARDEARHAAHHIGHAVAHLSLHAVRAAERLLTRLVKRIRATHDVDAAPRETARPFVKTLADFKGRLKATRPKTSDTQH
jgi:hypothetical protein